MKRPLYNESNVPSVSGGRDNPPDRYDWVFMNADPSITLAAINALADQGYRIVAATETYVLMGNYKENK